MESDIQAIPLQVNTNTKRFELEVEGQISSVNFDIEGDKIYLAHAHVPASQRNRGIASVLTEKVLQQVEADGLKAVLMCSYIQAYVHKHPEWKRIISSN